MSEPTTPRVIPEIAGRIEDDRHTIRHICLHSSYEPLPGGSLPVDVYLDIRIVGDQYAPLFNSFATGIVGGFLDLATKMQLMPPPPVPPRARTLEEISDEVPGLRVHSITGRTAVISHLAKAALGSVSFICATEGMTFCGVGAIDTPNMKGLRTFNCVTVLPEAEANELADMVNQFMRDRGCVPEDQADKPN